MTILIVSHFYFPALGTRRRPVAELVNENWRQRENFEKSNLMRTWRMI